MATEQGETNQGAQLSSALGNDSVYSREHSPVPPCLGARARTSSGAQLGLVRRLRHLGFRPWHLLVLQTTERRIGRAIGFGIL